MFYELSSTIDHVFLDKTLNIWFDYDLEQMCLRKQFYPSNIFPLILFNGTNKTIKCQNSINYLNKLNVFQYKG